jgi:ketosteroid isomerase-like protein
LSSCSDALTQLVPGCEPFGREIFASNVRMVGKSDIRELRVLGDWAYTRNYIEMTIMPEDGQPVKRSGYTLTILRKGSGQWRLARDANLVT